MLTGTIPRQIFMLPSLKYMYLQNNTFHGTISNNFPESMLSESKLYEIALSKNKLEGSFPLIFANLTNLSKLCLFNFQR